eukprot:CAMPEP_0179903946 /NCGR_PEP_ID=MMETSP0982-20121206/41587_1 /TAXON_ID=483367 /ORGANISM="non described non described, Strain CCMP 2436" /LENGTH=262 /DNA_ID=CAMNT_0021803631 /DNA_START=66 /DNA_END=855 /DNA_ORIENTATION=-
MTLRAPIDTYPPTCHTTLVETVPPTRWTLTSAQVEDLVDSRRRENDIPVGEGAAVEAPSCTEGDISIHEESAFHGTARSNRHISTHLPHNVGRNHTSDQVDFDVGGHRKVAHDAYDENVGRSALQEDIAIDVDVRVPLVGALCEGEPADGRRAAVGFRRERGRPRRDVGVGGIEVGERGLQHAPLPVLERFAVPDKCRPDERDGFHRAYGPRHEAIGGSNVATRREHGKVTGSAEVHRPLQHFIFDRATARQGEQHKAPGAQ